MTTYIIKVKSANGERKLSLVDAVSIDDAKKKLEHTDKLLNNKSEILGELKRLQHEKKV